MEFEKWDKIIKENKYDMLFLEIYYNLTCNEEFKTFTDKEKETLIHFIHRAYLKDETHSDLGYMCDAAIGYKNKILKNSDTFSTYDFLEVCYEKL